MIICDVTLLKRLGSQPPVRIFSSQCGPRCVIITSGTAGMS